MVDDYVIQVLNGNVDAYRKVVSALKGKAHTVAVSIVDDDQAAKDVVQTAFIKAYEKLNSFNFNSAFETWFMRIVLNEAYMQKRKTQRTAKVIDQNQLPPVGKQPEADKDLNSASQKESIRQTMSELTAEQSLALKLFYLEEYSIQTIAEVMEWTESKVKVTLHRARKSFKDKLTHRLGYKKEDLL